MPKQELYKQFISRMEAAEESGNYLEASWYAYAVLEDRLRSLLRNSGGERANGSGKRIKMLGAKLDELQHRAKKDELLKANFEHDKLDDWRSSRNSLMHAMADASMDISQIDVAAKQLAIEGASLVRAYSSACRRLKKHRAKVTA